VRGSAGANRSFLIPAGLDDGRAKPFRDRARAFPLRGKTIRIDPPMGWALPLLVELFLGFTKGTDWRKASPFPNPSGSKIARRAATVDWKT
jgi:hypothetical protein